jgi:RNA polymerase sigma-70 factor (ECF subfamily)
VRELPGVPWSDVNVVSLTLPCVETGLRRSPSLLAKAQDGDADAFCELCREYEARLLRQAVAVCGDIHSAEDLAQDTLVEAWRCIRRYNGRCQFFTWLCAILLNRNRNLRRIKRPFAFTALSRGDEESAILTLDTLSDDRISPDQVTQLTERAQFLQGCIRRLPPKQREVIHLRFYVDHSLDGIAAALDCSVGTVKSRLFHALESLRSMNALVEQYQELKPNEV